MDGPRTLGRYEILSEIGRGGMGVVYRAREPGLDREVALKTLLAGDFAEEEDIQRFLAEAKMLANLKHPGIVPLFDWGREGDRVYFTMPVLDGNPLEGRADLAVRGAVEYARKILAALAYAHEHGIIHRDLKPANVMVTESDQVILMDFGLARRKAGSSQQLTMSGAIMGTPAYMSPEQARGEARKADERSDIYAVGAILYELLGGRPVFEFTGDWVKDLRTLVEDPPEHLRKVKSSIGPDLATIVHKALEKEPDRRYANAAEMSEDLGRFLDHKPIQARPPSVLYLARKWMVRNRGLSAAFIVALVALLVVLGSNALRWNREWNEKADAIRTAYAALDRAGETGKWEESLDQARRAVGDGGHSEAPRLVRLIHVRSAEYWMSLGRFDKALGSLETVPPELVGDPDIIRLRRRAEGTGSISIDTVPSGAEVAIWSAEEWERQLAASLKETDQRNRSRLRRILACDWKNFGAWSFRNGVPEGVRGVDDGFEFPTKRLSPVRMTLRGRVVTAESWELALWARGEKQEESWAARDECRIRWGPERTVDLRYGDFLQDEADLSDDAFSVGREFTIVCEWAFDCGRVSINGRAVLESYRDDEGDLQERSGLRLAGDAVSIEEVRIEIADEMDWEEPPEEPRVVDWKPRVFGVTPIRNRPLPMGSYVLEMKSADRVIRYPVRIDRNGHWIDRQVRLDHDVPEGMVLVPGGRALIGGKQRVVPSFAISRFEVTKKQMYAFISSLPDEERGILAPRSSEEVDRTPETEDYGYDRYFPGVEGSQDQQPVAFVWYETAVAYCRWLSKKTGRRYRLPTAVEWEKAAAGVDGRAYPWGNAFDPRLAKLHHGVNRVLDVNSHPLGASPYRVLHMCGHVAEWTSTSYRGERDVKVVKGGSFVSKADDARCQSERRFSSGRTLEDVGFRIVLELP